MTGILQALLGGLGTAVSAATDAYFNLVTLLLPGNGTNGAQNNTFLDSSSNNFTITRNGNTTQGTFSPFSQTGWSGNFNTSTTYLTVTDTTNLRFGSGNFTIEAWVYRAASGAVQTIASKGASTPTGWVFQISAADKLVFTDTSTSITGATTLNANTWYYVAVVRAGTGTNQTTLYVNATSDATGTSATNFNQTTNMLIGADRSTANFANGYISNLRLSNTNRTISSTPTSALTADSNTIFLALNSNWFQYTDSTAAYTAMSVTGTPSVQAFSPFAPTAAYSAATIGGSGYFDGTGDYLTVANNAAFNLGATFTIEFWIYRTSTGLQRILSRQDGISPFNGFNISYGEVAGSYVFDASGTQITFSDSNINQWVHLAWVDNATSATVYRNGVSVGTATQTAQTPSSNTTLNIGRREDNSNFLNGYLAGLKIIKGTAVVPTGVPTTPPVDTTNTSLLLNFTNAGITDATAKNDLETVGNAQISTTQSKFGGSSMYFDGTDDRLVAPASPNIAFGTGDFTVEAWVYTTTLAGERGFIQTSDTVGGLKTTYTTGITIAIGTSPYAIGVNVGGTSITSGTTYITTNTWTHIAVTRASGSVRLFINGNLVGGPTTVTTSLDGQNICIGGYYSTAYLWNGYIDDLRITKGYARYTANFSAPSAAFALQ